MHFSVVWSHDAFPGELLERLARDMHTPFAFPEPIRLTHCSAPNAYWDEDCRDVVLCFELMTAFLKIAGQPQVAAAVESFRARQCRVTSARIEAVVHIEERTMAKSVRRRHAAVAIAIAIGVSGMLGFPGCGVAVAQDIILEGTSDEWRWSITPYLWGSDIDTDIRFPGGQEIGGTAKFDDILDKLDFGGMLHVEGRRGAWGMFVDATYLALSDDTTQGPFSVESELDTGLYEFAVTYTPGGDDGALHSIYRCPHR